MRECACVWVSVYAHIFQCIARLSSSDSMCLALCRCVCRLCVCACVSLPVCACTYLLSVRVKHLKTFIFRPAIMLHYWHNSRCQRRQFSQCSTLSSISFPLPFPLYRLPFLFYVYFLCSPPFGFYCWLTAELVLFDSLGFMAWIEWEEWMKDTSRGYWICQRRRTTTTTIASQAVKHPWRNRIFYRLDWAGFWLCI